MDKMLFLFCLCLAVCAVNAANRVWCVSQYNGASRPISFHLVNTTCWNKGNFSTNPTSIPARSIMKFNSSADLSSSACKGASVRQLFFNVSDPAGHFTAVVRLGDQRGVCSYKIFVKGEQPHGNNIPCSITPKLRFNYHPIPSNAFLEFPKIGGKDYEYYLKPIDEADEI